jgi:hypothetical protein
MLHERPGPSPGSLAVAGLGRDGSLPCCCCRLCHVWLVGRSHGACAGWREAKLATPLHACTQPDHRIDRTLGGDNVHEAVLTIVHCTQKKLGRSENKQDFFAGMLCNGVYKRTAGPVAIRLDLICAEPLFGF